MSCTYSTACIWLYLYTSHAYIAILVAKINNILLFLWLTYHGIKEKTSHDEVPFHAPLSRTLIMTWGTRDFNGKISPLSRVAERGTFKSLPIKLYFFNKLNTKLLNCKYMYT